MRDGVTPLLAAKAGLRRVEEARNLQGKSKEHGSAHRDQHRTQFNPNTSRSMASTRSTACSEYKTRLEVDNCLRVSTATLTLPETSILNQNEKNNPACIIVLN